MKLARFQADATLMYAIQQASGASSADILAHFYRTSMELVESLKKSQAYYPSRKLVTMYPGTYIPFSLETSCDRGFKQLFISICFPRKLTYLEGVDKLANEIAEAIMLGDELPNLPKFNAPMLKAPRGKKHLLK